MTTALSIIVDAYERCNRLSPGEVLSAEDAAYGLRRLNLVVDELAGQDLYVYLSLLVSAQAYGTVTLGSGVWSGIKSGTEIVSATADNFAMDPLTIKQYNELYNQNLAGLPKYWAHDGSTTVFLFPVPTGQTIKFQTRATINSFADQTTDYAVPDGWRAALGATLAVRIAPNIIGRVTKDLLKAEADTLNNISKFEPRIVDNDAFTRSKKAGGLELFNGGR